uniref:TetR/AcrR family transcriptional regulator n=1 Tax=Bordetella sputigena TaxID=1416810 RepID=UPI0039EF1783
MVDPHDLLKVGRSAFAKHGFEATSVRAIARDAGVDPALMMHHFGSKEALWSAIVEQIAAQILPMIRATIELRTSALGPRQRVERALGLLIDQVFLDPDIGVFFSTAATERGERLDLLIDRLVRPYHDAFLPLLRDAMDAGELARNDPQVMFLMLTNAIGRTVSYGHVLAAFSSLPQCPEAFREAVYCTAVAMLG